MTEKVHMPQLGLTMEEGTIVEWAKQIGEHVEAGETLLVIETDKAEVDVEAQTSGYLVKAAEADLTVPVGAVIGAVADTPDDPASDVELYAP